MRLTIGATAAAAAALAGATTPALAQSKMFQLAPIVIGASAAKDPPPGSGATLYPNEARKAGIEGRAVLHCVIQPEGRFSDCAAYAEEPRGQGFAAAAIATAASVRPPAGDRQGGGVAKAQAVMTFLFTLDEQERRVVDIMKVNWEAKPGGREFANVFPEAAQRSSVEGQALISCSITAEGRLANCRALFESPYNWRFGEAALRLSSGFKMHMILKDGSQVPTDAVVRMAIQFKLPRG